MEYLWLLLITLAVALVIYWVVNNKKTATKASSQEEPISKVEEDPLDQLLVLNLSIRKAGIDKELTQHCEDVIDQLMDLIPKVNEAAAAGSELIWTVNRIATEYLPNKCVNPYLALSREQQQVTATMEQMRTNLTTLQQELQAVAELLAKKDQKEFDAKAAFLKHRFSNN